MITSNINRKKILLILHWCINKFGKSDYNEFPKLRVYKSMGKSSYVDREYGLRGLYYYTTNTINVYLGTHPSVRELCKTIIHEYKHYMLDEKEYRKIEADLIDIDNNYLPNKHPHEQLAIEFENQWAEQCFKELKSRLYH